MMNLVFEELHVRVQAYRSAINKEMNFQFSADI